MHFRARTYLLFLLLIFTIIFILPTGVIGQGEDCHECHGTDGDYTFEPITIEPLTPRVVSPGEEFEHLIVLDHPGRYFANSVTIQLNLNSAPNLELLDDDSVLIDILSNGKKTVSFRMKGKESYQSQRIKTIVTYSANFHYDPTEYQEILDFSVTIDRIILSPSTWSIEMNTGDEKVITIEALDVAKYVLLIPSASLKNIVDIDSNSPNSISKGNSFNINVKAKGTGDGKLNLVFEDEDGNPHKVTLDIIVTSKVSKEGSIWVLVGMITGISSWIILFLSVVVGAPFKKIKQPLNKVFRSALVRKEFHCWICYILVVLALFHAVVVMAHHWNGAMLATTFIIADVSMEYGYYINLGTIAWFSMILVSITGIFWKQMIKLLKYKTWRWTHNILTILALATSITHGIILLHSRFF